MANHRTFTDVWLFFEAWVFLALARILLVFFPFRKILPLLGRTVANQEEILPNKNEFFSIQLAIKRARRFSYWRTMCFEQALCAKFMLSLRKRKSTLYLGVRRDPDTREFQAHAWLICNREIVTGGSEAPHFKVHSRFYG